MFYHLVPNVRSRSDEGQPQRPLFMKTIPMSHFRSPQAPRVEQIPLLKVLRNLLVRVYAAAVNGPEPTL